MTVELFILFAFAFIAATIFPAQSELVLASLAIKKEYSDALLLLVATSGNVLGSLFNWFLGRYIAKFQNKKWFPFKEKSLDKALKFYNKWGIFSLFFAWVPFIGDALTVIAGVFRANICIFLILVTIGKFMRYFVVLSLVNQAR